jgi:hypothetical protein
MSNSPMNTRAGYFAAALLAGGVTGLAVVTLPARAGAAVAPVITTVAGGPGRGTATNVDDRR